MSPKYADIIIDISHEAIDRTFQYRIPESLAEQVRIGTFVSIPFGRGNHTRNGYVVGLSETPNYDEEKLKEIAEVVTSGVPIESTLIELAAFIRERYGSTMINALKTVMPVRDKVRGLTKKEVRLLLPLSAVAEYSARYAKKNARAKLRLIGELAEETVLPYSLVTGKLNISTATLRALEQEEVIAIEEEGYYRNVLKGALAEPETLTENITLNEEQRTAVDTVISDYEALRPSTYLLKGVTGSGKTLVYIEMIDRMLAMGKEAIVLIPEIALTYQTVKRFRRRFGDKVTIINSRLSKGERYDQFEKAKNGEVSVIIGPRSALFAPFQNLGLIIIDEEHETTYKSENTPKYHAREVAIFRAKQAGASVVLGSATPSVESYYRATKGEYRLLELKHRAVQGASLSKVSVVDLREELKRGNRSIFSGLLQEKIGERLERGEQIMLFLNRRGFSGFLSCRSCGHVMRCPHCDVSLTEHNFGAGRQKLICHYCGYEEGRPKLCPECGSPYIAGFGIGTQRVEEQVQQLFPKARVARMDFDTTKEKDGHEKILSKFAAGEADILVGTQMIVKGHDYSNVTLVGVIAADLTLFDNDYKAVERTFDLLTQAAGRAGRGTRQGDVVIQTYKPEHYCIETAANQDYEAFYREEKAYRSLLQYPPFCHVLAIFMEQEDSGALERNAKRLHEALSKLNLTDDEDSCGGETDRCLSVQIIGPSDATISKVNDRYRKVIYLKHRDYGVLVKAKNFLERLIEEENIGKKCYITFDFDPMHGY